MKMHKAIMKAIKDTLKNYKGIEITSATGWEWEKGFNKVKINITSKNFTGVQIESEIIATVYENDITTFEVL